MFGKKKPVKEDTFEINLELKNKSYFCLHWNIDYQTGMKLFEKLRIKLKKSKKWFEYEYQEKRKLIIEKERIEGIVLRREE